MRDELCTDTLRASVQKFLAIFREVGEDGKCGKCGNAVILSGVCVCLGRVCVRLRGGGPACARARALPGGGEQHPAAQQAARGVQLPPLQVWLLTTFDPRRMGVKRRLGGH